jgi:hypothetical protein
MAPTQPAKPQQPASWSPIRYTDTSHRECIYQRHHTFAGAQRSSQLKVCRLLEQARSCQQSGPTGKARGRVYPDDVAVHEIEERGCRR